MKISEHDKKHFEEVYISYFARMKRFAQSYVLREEDAENIVQDIFIDLWDKKLDFANITNISGFLFLSLKNKCIDHIRKKTTEKKVADEIQNDFLISLKLKFDSLELLDDKFLASSDIDAVIHEAINNLPEKCRQIFVMNKFEGIKQKVIADELNISIHTVESQMSIAYRKLKEDLKEYFCVLLFFI